MLLFFESYVGISWDSGDVVVVVRCELCPLQQVVHCWYLSGDHLNCIHEKMCVPLSRCSTGTGTCSTQD